MTLLPGRPRKRVVLTEPLILDSYQLVENTDYVVPLDFRWGEVGCAIYWPREARGIRWRDSTLVSEAKRWQPWWGRPRNEWPEDKIPGGMAAIKLDCAHRPQIDGLHIEGFSAAGLYFVGCEGGNIQRVSVTRCLNGVYGQVFNEVFSRNMAWKTIRVWDLWTGPSWLLPGYESYTGDLRQLGQWPSKLDVGRWVGNDGFAAVLLDSTIEDVEVRGELFGGFKLGRSQRCVITGLRTNCVAIQGGNPGDSGSADLHFRDVLIDKSRCYGDISDGHGNGFQIAINCKRILIDGFACLSGGQNGHGAQVTLDSEATFRNGLFSGWNGVRGPVPAHALEISRDCKVNDDFETANHFHDQARRVLVSS